MRKTIYYKAYNSDILLTTEPSTVMLAEFFIIILIKLSIELAAKLIIET